MLRKRIIPVLLINGEDLVKTVKFSNSRYIGDPINAVKIFNEKQAHELFLLDITENRRLKGPNFKILEKISSEAFMPMSYGGGIESIDQIKKLLAIGFEKVCINSSLYSNKELLVEASQRFGSQCIIGGVDIKKNIFNKYELFSNSGKKKERYSIEDWICELQQKGAGELFLNNISRDGTMVGFDKQIILALKKHIKIPFIACGGASSVQDIEKIFRETNINAAAAGSIFVYFGKLKAVLINYPENSNEYN